MHHCDEDDREEMRAANCTLQVAGYVEKQRGAEYSRAATLRFRYLSTRLRRFAVSFSWNRPEATGKSPDKLVHARMRGVVSMEVSPNINHLPAVFVVARSHVASIRSGASEMSSIQVRPRESGC